MNKVPHYPTATARSRSYRYAFPRTDSFLLTMSLKSFLLQMVCLRYFVTTGTETNDVSISKATTQVAAPKWALRSQEERRIWSAAISSTTDEGIWGKRLVSVLDIVRLYPGISPSTSTATTYVTFASS